MKRIWILAVVLFLLAGCASFQPDETGMAPIVGTLNAMQAANVASAPFNPYAIPIAGILGTLAAIISAYAASQRKQKVTATKKYTAHKRGVEASMRESDPRNADMLYEKIETERNRLGIK